MIQPDDFLRRLKRLFSVPGDDMGLVRAQFAAFSKQVPLLYFILISSCVATAYSFVHVAPLWLSLVVPGLLAVICATRCVWWLRAPGRKLTDAQILKIMRVTRTAAPLLTVAFTIWGLMLYQYGDGYAKSQVMFCMALTVIGCVFCLMHLRPAALAVTLCANTPFILFFLFEGHDSLRAVSFNLALVSVAMVIILFVCSRDFSRLVASQAETRRLSDENFKVANLDSLTGLPNRRWFFTALDARFENAVRDNAPFAVGIIDLDGFKPVNDTYGHATGDKLLAEVGQRLSDVCGEHISLARLGGDEFAMVVTGTVTPEALLALGRSVACVLRVPYAIGAAQAQINCSIGFAVWPDNAATPEQMFECADYALYFAKRHRRGETVLFSADHEAQIRNDGVIEQALQLADLRAELSMVFQPIVSMATCRTLAFEALARWTSPTLGFVPPDRFIAAAERIGLIGTVTRILFEKALEAAAQWPEDVRLSFNLSAHDVAATDCVLALIAAVNRSGVSPKRIDFEITETAVVHDFVAARAGVEAFKLVGAGISLDDFGTGYSSLSHVHRLPLDKLKIDRSFVTDIATNPASVKIVRSLLGLCADMDLDCIVEGIETEEQVKILTALGCFNAQGYYYARPMKPQDIAAWLQIDRPVQASIRA